MCEIVNNASHGLKAKHKPRAKMAYVQHQPNEFVTCSQTSLSHPNKFIMSDLWTRCERRMCRRSHQQQRPAVTMGSAPGAAATNVTNGVRRV